MFWESRTFCVFFTSVIYYWDSIFFVLVLIFIIFLLKIFGWFLDLLVHICWSMKCCPLFYFNNFFNWNFGWSQDLLVHVCWSKDCCRLIFIFYFSILLNFFFFFWCSCPMEGGCPSPGTCWAYPGPALVVTCNIMMTYIYKRDRVLTNTFLLSFQSFLRLVTSWWHIYKRDRVLTNMFLLSFQNFLRLTVYVRRKLLLPYKKKMYTTKNTCFAWERISSEDVLVVAHEHELARSLE